MKKWTTNSWRKFPVKHIPKYEDDKELNLVLSKLKSFPPLVFAGETTPVSYTHLTLPTKA